jgi:hypothetical protein
MHSSILIACIPSRMYTCASWAVPKRKSAGKQAKQYHLSVATWTHSTAPEVRPFPWNCGSSVDVRQFLVLRQHLLDFRAKFKWHSIESFFLFEYNGMQCGPSSLTFLSNILLPSSGFGAFHGLQNEDSMCVRNVDGLIRKYTLHSIRLYFSRLSLGYLEPRYSKPGKIWGFHCGDYEELRLLGCYAAWLW